MPSTKLSAKAEAQKQFDRLVRMYISANRTNITECAGRMGISAKTLYNRTNSLGDFTLSELGRLRAVLGIPIDEFVEALRPRL